MPDTPPPVPWQSPPAGFSPGTNLPYSVVQYAHVVLNDSSKGYYDSETQVIGDTTYLYRVEPHYDNHPRGYGDPYWHRGVTVWQSGPGAPSDGSGGGGNTTNQSKEPAPSYTFPDFEPAGTSVPMGLLAGAIFGIATYILVGRFVLR